MEIIRKLQTVACNAVLEFYDMRLRARAGTLLQEFKFDYSLNPHKYVKDALTYQRVERSGNNSDADGEKPSRWNAAIRFMGKYDGFLGEIRPSMVLNLCLLHIILGIGLVVNAMLPGITNIVSPGSSRWSAASSWLIGPVSAHGRGVVLVSAILLIVFGVLGILSVHFSRNWVMSLSFVVGHCCAAWMILFLVVLGLFDALRRDDTVLLPALLNGGVSAIWLFLQANACRFVIADMIRLAFPVLFSKLNVAGAGANPLRKEFISATQRFDLDADHKLSRCLLDVLRRQEFVDDNHIVCNLLFTVPVPPSLLLG